MNNPTGLPIRTRFTALALLALCAALPACAVEGDPMAFEGDARADHAADGRSTRGAYDDDGGAASSDGVAPVPIGDAAAGPDGAVGPCGGTAVSLSAATAEFLLVIDRSGSMTEPAATGVTKWAALRMALRTVLPAFDTRISMGLVAFPSASASAPGASAVAQCDAPDAVDVEPDFHHASTVLGALARSTPGGSTPTAAALALAARYFASQPDPTMPRYVLLATDGGPNCDLRLDPATCRCSGPSQGCRVGGTAGASECLDEPATVAAIRRLASQGIQTFVVGLPGTESFSDVMNAMAVAGGRPRAGATRYYNAGSPDALTHALESITTGLVDCRFDLHMPAPDPHDVDVRLGGMSLPYDPSHTNGWDWSDDAHDEVVFYGATCTSVQSAAGGESLIAAFGCPPPG